MTCLPHTRLFLGPSLSVLISGSHIQVLRTSNGKLVHSTVSMVGDEREALLKSGPVRCATVDETFKHLVTTGDDKKMKVWQIDELKLLSVRELPKKPTKIAFTHDRQTIVVSDKFGDVFSYPLHLKPKTTDEAEPRAGSSKRGALTSHENPSDGELILGHVSLLTTFLLTPDEKYIITADRDEHIRISWYPKGCVIERYCLGHEKFVSAIHIPAFAPEALISGGGDPMLKVWDWMSGEQIIEVHVLDVVEPYIKVKAPKSRRGWDEGDGDEGSTAENNTMRKKKRGRKGRGKGATAEHEKEGSVEGTTGAEHSPGMANAVEEGVAERDIEMTPMPSGGDVPADPDSGDADRSVLVIHKIRSLDLGEHGKFVLFSAVGATALFYCHYPKAGSASPPKVHATDLGYPVVDFTLGPDQLTWILLDSSGLETDNSAEKPLAAVLLSWVSGVPIQVQPSDAPVLLKSLQTTCVLPTTPTDLKTLDLYGALSSLPKNVDPEHDPLRRDLLAEVALAEVSTPEPGGEDKSPKKKKLTQREQARLRKKRALAAKLLEDAKRQGEAWAEAGADKVEEGRESKRVRPDNEVATVVVESTSEPMDES